jgi:AraC-like DNA-binding protein
VDVLTLVNLPRVLPRAAADLLGERSAQLAACSPVHGEGSLLHRARGNQLAFHFLADLCVVCNLRIEAPLSRLRPLLPVLEYMRGHLAERQSRGGLAALAGLSPTRFHYVFKGLLGASPMKYLARLRMNEAERLLLEEDLLIKEVAARCGFPDQFNFSRQFRARHGVSPAEYRRDTRLSLAWLRRGADGCWNSSRPTGSFRSSNRRANRGQNTN